MRISCTLAALALLISFAQAGNDSLAGHWKVSLFEDGQQLNFWLLKLEVKDGKLTGSALSLRGVPPSKMGKVETKGDQLAFTISVAGREFSFQGKLAKADAKKIMGSIRLGNRLIPAMLEASAARNAYELDKEFLARSPNDPRVFDLVLGLIGQAAKEKATVNEVREWTQLALKPSANYGERWQREFAIRLAETLVKEKEFAPVAAEVARSAEKLKGDAEYQLRVLGVLQTALKQSGKEGEAKLLGQRLDELETVAHREYRKTALSFKVEPFAGRKGKSNRAVLVELFTGAQCPPCVAADLAFDALEKAYKPTEVVLLQYHLHIPGPDVLTNPDSEARQEFYGKSIRGTPTILFNGKPGAAGGGNSDAAKGKFLDYQIVIDPLLEKAAVVSLEAKAVRKGNKIHIQAQTQNLEKPGPKIRLRFALVEDWVRYRGTNGMRYHSKVVRALPGGADGLALEKKNAEHAAVVDLAELETKLTKYLDNFAKNEAAFPDAQRPMRFRDLSVVAFVQNDDTSEVLQALEVKVKNE
jgi:thiol-disulfide isomerase/thioredoxin